MNYNLLMHVDLNDETRLRLALTNIENYYSALPKESFKVVMVVNGPAVNLFKKASAPHADAVNALAAQGASFRLCNNALHKFAIKSEELLDCVTIVPAGMIELVHLQREGYAYIKP